MRVPGSQPGSRISAGLKKIIHRPKAAAPVWGAQNPPKAGTFPIEGPHALWRRIAGGNPAADRSGRAGGTALQAGAQAPADVGLLPLPPGEIPQLQGRE